MEAKHDVLNMAVIGEKWSEAGLKPTMEVFVKTQKTGQGQRYSLPYYLHDFSNLSD